MNQPNFTLPACPICSTIMSVERPFWRFASNASAQRKRNCYILSGCVHVVGQRNQAQIRDDPEEWKAVEDQWAHYAQQLFDHKTAGWTDP